MLIYYSLESGLQSRWQVDSTHVLKAECSQYYIRLSTLSNFLNITNPCSKNVPQALPHSKPRSKLSETSLGRREAGQRVSLSRNTGCREAWVLSLKGDGLEASRLSTSFPRRRRIPTLSLSEETLPGQSLNPKWMAAELQPRPSPHRACHRGRLQDSPLMLLFQCSPNRLFPPSAAG